MVRYKKRWIDGDEVDMVEVKRRKGSRTAITFIDAKKTCNMCRLYFERFEIKLCKLIDSKEDK
jgi:hypothetical protein